MFIGLCVVYFIGGFVLYHSIFDVLYLDFKNGFMKECIGYFMFSLIMTGITMKFWYISAIVIALGGAGFVNKAKTQSRKKIAIVISVLLVLFVICGGYIYTMIN